MAKNVLKSVRLTDEVFALIDNRSEEGFNNKFEAMVLEFYRSESQRQGEIARLDRFILQKKEELQEYIVRCNRWYGVVSQLEKVVTEVKQLEIVSQKLADPR